MTLINSIEELNRIISNLRKDINDLTKTYWLEHEEYAFLRLSIMTLLDNFEEYDRINHKEA